MHDRRIARGSTYAAMVIPAGTNPDAMLMDKKQDDLKKKSMKKSQKVSPITLLAAPASIHLLALVACILLRGEGFEIQPLPIDAPADAHKEQCLPEQGHPHAGAGARQTPHGGAD
jgi:hypothetical protein